MFPANERTEQANSTEADSESEERGDLIQFYNSAYVLKMKAFALKYAQSTLDNKVGVLLCLLKIVFVITVLNFFLLIIWKKYLTLSPSFSVKMEAPPLSPFPSVRAQPLSPRRVSQRHSIFVSPHKNSSSLTPSTAYTYKFTGSPSKVSQTTGCHNKHQQ